MIYWHITKDRTAKVWYGGDPATDTPDLEEDVSGMDMRWRVSGNTFEIPSDLTAMVLDDLLITYDGTDPPTPEGMRVWADLKAGRTERFQPDSYLESDDQDTI